MLLNNCQIDYFKEVLIIRASHSFVLNPRIAGMLVLVFFYSSWEKAG